MKKWFYLIVTLQLLFLIGETATNTVGLMRGRTVILKTVPVDPRSMFTGHYMQLSYDVSTIDLKALDYPKPAKSFARGTTVYVGLSPEKPYALVKDVSLSKPEMEYSLVYLRGQVTGSNDNVIMVKYGLERYYIPETREDEANNLGWTRNDVAAEVAVNSSGTGRIRKILVGGKPLEY